MTDSELAVLECKKIFEKRYKFSSYAKSMEPYYVACFLRGYELGRDSGLNQGYKSGAFERKKGA